jgi:hypothetical protein
MTISFSPSPNYNTASRGEGKTFIPPGKLGVFWLIFINLKFQDM